MKNELKIDGKILVRNSAINMVGQIIPIVIAVLSIPFIVRGIGTERFGLLSIALIVLGYFTVFDLGLGRATVKFVSEALGKNEAKNVSQIVWTSVSVQLIFGLLGAITLICITPVLVNHILKISHEFIGEARGMFYSLALAIPVILITGSLSGILEASQRFDLINAVKIPVNCLTFLIPLAGAILKLSLPSIIMIIIISRLLALFTYFFIGLHLFPGLKKYSPNYNLFRKLFSFGGWVMVSSLISPLLVYFDRFLIGSVLSMTDVTYYTAPYEAVTRLLIIPASMTITLFPAFSSLEALQDSARIENIFFSSLKYMLLFLGPLIILISVFSNDILHIWLGNDFAARSTVLLQIIAFGVLFNSLAQFPYALLQGIGRPDLPAKFHLIELTLYIGIAYYLVKRYGINGAAIAWTIRVTVDSILLFTGVFKVYRLRLKYLISRGLIWSITALSVFGALNYLIKIFGQPLGLPVQGVFVVILLAGFLFFVWIKGFDIKEREILLRILR